MTKPIAAPTVVDDMTEKAAGAAADVAAAAAAVADEAGRVATSAKDALAEMRRIVEDFAAATGERAGAAASAVEASGAATVERFGALVDDARVLGRNGLDEVADTVAKRPLAALAVAAGVGLALGLLTRSGGKR